MSPLALWLERVQRRHARRSDLAAALLLGEGFAYARQRLSPMLVRVAIRTALHALEIYLLMLALPFEYLAPLLGYRALVQIAGTAHWGALEPLRRRVREQAPAAARWTITRWLGVSTALGALPALLFVWRMLDPRTPLSLFDAYGFACFARLAGDMYARTLHSGVFALRRVYRPLTSLVLADVLELTMIIAGFDALGPWVLPLAIAISGALDVQLSVHYTRLAYRLRRHQLPRISDLRRAFGGRAPQRSELTGIAREIAAASLAHATTQLDGWLLLLLVARIDTARAASSSLALAYYVLRPCLGFSAQWVRAFYFDLSRLESGALHAFRAHLARYLRRVGFGCAALVSLPGVIAAACLDPRGDRWALAWLVPLAFVRALFAQRQLEAFVHQRYARLSLVAAVLAAGFMAAVACDVSATLLLACAAALLALGCALLPAPLQASELVGGLAAWLHATHASPHVQLAVMRVAPGSVDPARVASALEAAIAGARVARCGRWQLLLSTDAALSQASVIAAGGGVLSELWISGRGTGRDVLLASSSHLPDVLARALEAEPPAPSTLLTEFQRELPNGTPIDVRGGAGRMSPQLLRRGQLNELFAQIVLACQQREPTRRGRLPLSLAVYAPAGRAELVFIAPRGAPAFAAFRARVRAATLTASLRIDHAEHAGVMLVLTRWLAGVGVRAMHVSYPRERARRHFGPRC